MDKKYDEVMEHIEVTPEMRQRILGNIQKMDLHKKKSAKVISLPGWRKLAALAACLAVVLTGMFTLPHLFQVPDDSDILHTAGGIVEVASAEELSKATGFDVADLDTLPFRIEEAAYISYWNDLAEIEYGGEGQTATYRKGPGQEDVSGDYNFYTTKTSITVGSLTVTLKGDGKDYTLALWCDGGFSYSLRLSEGLSETEWRSIFDTEI